MPQRGLYVNFRSVVELNGGIIVPDVSCDTDVPDVSCDTNKPRSYCGMDVHEYTYLVECDMIFSVEVTRSRDVILLQGFVRHRNQTFDGSVIHRF